MRDWLSIRNTKTKCGTFSCSVKPTSENCISYRLKIDDIINEPLVRRLGLMTDEGNAETSFPSCFNFAFKGLQQTT